MVYFPLSRVSFLLRVSFGTSRSFLEEPQPAETATSGPRWARRGFIASSPLVLAGGADKRWNTLEFLEHCMARRKPRNRQVNSHTTAGVPSSMLWQTQRIPLEGSSFLSSPGIGKRGKCLHICGTTTSKRRYSSRVVVPNDVLEHLVRSFTANGGHSRPRPGQISLAESPQPVMRCQGEQVKKTQVGPGQLLMAKCCRSWPTPDFVLSASPHRTQEARACSGCTAAVAPASPTVQQASLSCPVTSTDTSISLPSLLIFDTDISEPGSWHPAHESTSGTIYPRRRAWQHASPACQVPIPTAAMDGCGTCCGKSHLTGINLPMSLPRIPAVVIMYLLPSKKAPIRETRARLG